MFDQRAALIPIDLQQAFDDPRWGRRNNPQLDDHGRRLLAAWRQRGWPLLHVRHDSIEPDSTLRPDRPGHALRPGFEPQADEPLIGKSVNAAFIGTDLDLRLRRLGVDTIVLFGLTTDQCVSTTARVGANLGYRVVVVGDACAAFGLAGVDGEPVPAETVHRVHLATLHAEFGRVVCTDEVCRALAR